MTTVRIDPDASVEYAVGVAAGGEPTSVAASQTWYPDRQVLVGYTHWWTVDVMVDGGVEWVRARGADVTVDGDAGYGSAGFGAGGYGE